MRAAILITNIVRGGASAGLVLVMWPVWRRRRSTFGMTVNDMKIITTAKRVRTTRG
ncbi:hypothetical protein D3C83_336300 [compost metagenome]